MSYISFVLDGEVEIVYLEILECHSLGNVLEMVCYGMWGKGADQYEIFSMLLENKESIRRILCHDEVVYKKTTNKECLVDFDITESLKLIIKIISW